VGDERKVVFWAAAWYAAKKATRMVTNCMLITDFSNQRK
jgi:hypothetical protein